MITNNDNIDKGQCNGSLCRFVSVKLKTGAWLYWKNWDGMKVNTITADKVEWIKMEHWPEPPPNTPRFFRLKMKKYNTVVKRMPIPGTTGVTVDVPKSSCTNFQSTPTSQLQDTNCKACQRI
jgi:hypothetical protein